MSIETLALRFEAPLMSFGSVHVDETGPTDRFPARSMVAGLIANALGYEHRDAEVLQRLQDRLSVASRIDREGEHLIDYHTVDLGHEDLREGWTTWGTVSGRGGGSAKEGTHIRRRHYLADAIVTLVMSLAPADEAPTLEDVARALDRPARPLFLGRKACIPASPLVLSLDRAANLRSALQRVSLARRARTSQGDAAAPEAPVLAALPARWPATQHDGDELASREVPIYDSRDWANQVHTGRTLYREGPLGSDP